MSPKHIKLTLAGLWAVALGGLGLVADVTSSSGWLMLASTAVVPPLVMMRYWNHPHQTLAQRIEQDLR